MKNAASRFPFFGNLAVLAALDQSRYFARDKGKAGTVIEDIRSKADEVAALMASRFGGLRRGQSADLAVMLRKRGGALPRKLRRQAQVLAQADQRINQPKLGKQQDFQKVEKAYLALVGYLKPIGKGARLQGRAISLGASLALALLLIGAITLWVMIRRGQI